MALVREDQPTFAGGEIGPELAARMDTAKYHTALLKSRNTIGRAAGGVVNRQGFEFVCELYDSTSHARLIPFSFSAEQTYVLPFENGLARVVSNGGAVLETELTITAITNAANAAISAVAHGYAVGDDVFFQGILGMTQINRLTGRVASVVDANTFTVGIDTRAFGAFTGATGGVAGNINGGSGGYPAGGPPANPPVPPTPAPSTPPNPAPITPVPGYVFPPIVVQVPDLSRLFF